MSKEYIFNPKQIVRETIEAQNKIYKNNKRAAKKRIIKEAATIDYTFVDERDLTETLTQYIYFIYQYDELFKEFDKLVHDVVWSHSIPTVDALDTEESDGWVLLINPKFAKTLLDERLKMVDRIDYDEHNDKWPTDYFRLFYSVVLYASVLAKTKSECSDDDLNRLSIAPKTAFNTLRNSYQNELPDVLGVLEKLLAQYSPKF